MHGHEQAVGPALRGEERAQWLAQRLVVARHHQHHQRFAVVMGRADHDVPQDALQAGTGGGDLRARQVIAQGERELVRACAVHRALDDWHDTPRPVREVPHRQSASACILRREHERGLVPEVPRHPVLAGRHARHRLDGGTLQAGRVPQQLLHRASLARQLLRIRDVLNLAATADAEVFADARHQRPS